MDAQANRVQALTRAEDGPRLIESLRAAVFATVMESRGLYIARDKAQATGFANNLLGHLARVQSNWRGLHDVLPASGQAKSNALESAMSGFVALRTELARVGVAEGAAAADKLGNNDPNRSARVALNRGIDELATITAGTVADLAAETIASGRRIALILLAVTTTAVVSTLGVILWLLRRSVSLPLRRLANALGEMSEGRFDDVVLPSPSQDEVGAITASAKVFLEKLVRNRELEAAAEAGRAARDRQAAALDSHTQDFGTSVSGVMTSLGQSAGKMHTAASDMSEAAKRTRDSTFDAVEGANASARDLNSVAVAAEEMAASIQEIARQVAHVTTAVRMAIDRATETDTKVAGLASAEDRIADVVRLISDVAGQTNLLALNATIEAARAGDAGKGFAVVAGEVKALASQTAHATHEIATQIMAIRAATDAAVRAVREVGLAIGQVEEVATTIAAAVTQQAAATREISRSVQSVTVATTNSAQAMEQVLTIAEQTDTASRSVLVAADEVGQTADTLRVEVNDFLSAVKRGEGDDRRAYERVPGTGAGASLSMHGLAAVQASVRDISRGGVALMCGGTAPPGTDVRVVVLEGERIPGRIVRFEDGVVTVAFRQDVASLTRVDRVLAAVMQRTRSAAA
jgi:methyl-accepting chemotaxis protein